MLQRDGSLIFSVDNAGALEIVPPEAERGTDESSGSHKSRRKLKERNEHGGLHLLLYIDLILLTAAIMYQLPVLYTFFLWKAVLPKVEYLKKFQKYSKPLFFGRILSKRNVLEMPKELRKFRQLLPHLWVNYHLRKEDEKLKKLLEIKERQKQRKEIQNKKIIKLLAEKKKLQEEKKKQQAQKRKLQQEQKQVQKNKK